MEAMIKGLDNAENPFTLSANEAEGSLAISSMVTDPSISDAELGAAMRKMAKPDEARPSLALVPTPPTKTNT